MNYEQKYKEALERIKSWVRGEHPECFCEAQKAAEFIFPELKESEDEGIKTAILNHLKKMWGNCQDDVCGVNVEDAIAWLEKQRDYDRLIEEIKKRKELLSKEKEKATSINDKLSLGGRIAMLQELLAFNICNTTDKEEPKYYKGDWVVRGGTIAQILDVQEQYYVGLDINGKDFTSSRFLNDDKIHLWTIKDAKAGDVLVCETDEVKWIFIYREIIPADSVVSHDLLRYYFLLEGNYLNCNGVSAMITDDYELYLKPATKEQRDLLFSKMKKAGYEWDSEKKELKKIETHYDIKNFHAGMPVLVRIYNNHKWCYLLFSHCYKHQGILHFSCGGAGWLQCIPFEGNEHLLGTTDMCDEKFINW